MTKINIMRKIRKTISQKDKFLQMTKEVDCEPIEEFEKKIKKISRVSATASKDKIKK